MPWIDPCCDGLRWPRHLACLCWVAGRTSAARVLAQKGGYERLAILRNGLGFVAGNRHVIIVAFSGSKTIEDWCYNLSSDLVAGFGGRVHEGFATLMGQVANSVVGTVEQLRDNGQFVWVAGYSRGGAIATLTAVALYQAIPNGVQVCTFGAPRTGDLAFALSYRVPHYRFENVDDPVPYFPFGNYVSVGTRILLTEAGGVYLPNGSELDRSGIEEEGVTHHFIEEYVSRLQPVGIW
jgi:pimeloyl-ACP methyl ester carboxylesterase